jgi:hypothetical protein
VHAFTDQPGSRHQQEATLLWCVLQSFQAALDARKAAKADGGAGGALPEGLTLEDPMALTQPGARDGQTKVIREDGGGMAYSWSAARWLLFQLCASGIASRKLHHPLKPLSQDILVIS